MKPTHILLFAVMILQVVSMGYVGYTLLEQIEEEIKAIQEIITEEQETIQELITLVTKAQAEPSALAMRDECNSTLTGVYFPAASYCVYVGGRNMEQINKTEYHEACHALIKEDKKHFCK